MNRFVASILAGWMLSGLAVEADSGADPLAELIPWFESAARTALAHAERQMGDGTIVYAPSGTTKYQAFWLRDYEMMLEAEVIPKERLVACAKLFLNALAADGSGVDCLPFTGGAIYKPAWGKFGDNPVLDGGPYTVSVAYLSWKQSGDAFFLGEETLAKLAKTLGAIPHNAKTGLCWIDPSKDYDRAPWGFHDTVHKKGDCLYTSVLEIVARRRFAEMLDAAGKGDAAGRERAQADAMTAAVNMNTELWDESFGLFRAATVKCREHDVWGSAFAVWSGVATEEHARSIAAYFRNHYSELVQHGQVRAMPAGEYWEHVDAVCVRDTYQNAYQNGGFWGTASGWFGWTLAQVDRPLAVQMFQALKADYASRGANEWIFGERTECHEYLSSIGLPLQALRRLTGVSAGTSVQKGETPAQKGIGVRSGTGCAEHPHLRQLPH